MTAERGDLRLVRVHLDQVAAALVHGDGELRRRIHRRRRAGDEHAIGGFRLLEARLEDVGRDGLPERDRVSHSFARKTNRTTRPVPRNDLGGRSEGKDIHNCGQREIARL